MREEKKYLVQETSEHLAKSDYVFLTDFTAITVENAAEIRALLAPLGAQFHVVKNTILNIAAKEKQIPDLGEWLAGPTAIITGGEEPSAIAKALVKFFKDKKKLTVKVAYVDKKLMNSEEVEALSELPSLPEVRAQLLSLISTPATQIVRILVEKNKAAGENSSEEAPAETPAEA